MGTIIGPGNDYVDTSLDKYIPLKYQSSEKVHDATMRFFKMYYLCDNIVEEQEEKLKELISILQQRKFTDTQSLTEVENWIVDYAWDEWKDYKEKTKNDKHPASFWRDYAYEALVRGRNKDISMDGEAIKYFATLNIKVLEYIFSSCLETNITFGDLCKYIPASFDSKKTDDIELMRRKTGHGTHSDFYDEDLHMKDRNGNVVHPSDKALQKDKKVNSRGESNAAFITKQTLRTFFPLIEGGVQTLKTTVGVDLYGVMSGKSIIAEKYDKDSFSFKNWDNNIIINLLPNALMSVAHRINNPTFNIVASTTPLLLQLITNFKERKNPLLFNDNDKEINWVQCGALFIPIIIESLKLLFPKNQFDRLIESKEAPVFNDANRLFGDFRQRIEETNNQQIPQGNPYMNVRREIKQPR